MITTKKGWSRIKMFSVVIILLLVISFIYFLMPAKIDADHLMMQEMAQAESGMVGVVGHDAIGIDPMEFLTTWNFNNLPDAERSNYYKESPQEDGSLLREYWITSVDRNIEIAPGIIFPAWTYNGQVPGPTIRATEGDTVRIHYINHGTKPHSIHTHGFHSSEMDGAMVHDLLMPGETFTYEFKAEPFGTHLYHCHGLPLSQHIHKGLYGTYIVDAKNDTRPKADKELIMVMNGFDTNFDLENDIYAVNSVAFYYDKNPIVVKKGELTRIHLINMLEFDQINSFHVHANFFSEYPTGTEMEPDFFTDTTVLGQGERSVLDIRFNKAGKFMFHAHKTEFAEKGWTGVFEVVE